MIEAAYVPLAPLTTIRVGGAAERLITATTAAEIIEAVRGADTAGEPVFLLSGGSNVVIADAGVPGTVVRIVSRGITVESVDPCGGALVRVAAGETWDEVVSRAVAEGWSGIEALSGIPGAAGSTPVQNVGAYGQEVAETIAEVRVWDRDRAAIRTLTVAECGFGYRDSVIKRAAGRLVVLDVLFRLRLADLSAPVRYDDLAAALGVAVGERVPLAQARDVVLEQRRRRGMVLDPDDHDTWSCGSFFTNPVVTRETAHRIAARAGIGSTSTGPERVTIPSWPTDEGRVKLSAAWLIERAGFGKGFGLPGPAALSTRHTLALTNRGGASAQDVLDLARTVRAGVVDAFGIELVNEPILVGLSW